MEQKSEYMVIYFCTACKMESGFTENDKAQCRHCDEQAEMILVKKEKITPEVMAERLKQLTDNMFSNLLSAYESMSEEDKSGVVGDTDAEKEMLNLLAKAKAFKEHVQNLELKNPDDNKMNQN